MNSYEFLLSSSGVRIWIEVIELLAELDCLSCCSCFGAWVEGTRVNAGGGGSIESAARGGSDGSAEFGPGGVVFGADDRFRFLSPAASPIPFPAPIVGRVEPGNGPLFLCNPVRTHSVFD